jgi:hypothetical protein
MNSIAYAVATSWWTTCVASPLHQCRRLATLPAHSPQDAPFPLAVLLHKPIDYVVTSPEDQNVPGGQPRAAVMKQCNPVQQQAGSVDLLCVSSNGM